MARSRKISVDRRRFLSSAVGGAAALVADTRAADAQQSEPPRPAAAQIMPKEADPDSPSSVEVLTADHPGSDFMVDVIKSLGFEYIAANPGLDDLPASDAGTRRYPLV